MVDDCPRQWTWRKTILHHVAKLLDMRIKIDGYPYGTSRCTTC